MNVQLERARKIIMPEQRECKQPFFHTQNSCGFNFSFASFSFTSKVFQKPCNFQRADQHTNEAKDAFLTFCGTFKFEVKVEIQADAQKSSLSIQ